ATARARPQACRSSVSSNGAQYRAARALVMIVSDEYQGVARAASRTRRAASTALRWSMVVNRALEKARTSSRRSRWMGMTISRRVSESLSVFNSTAAISWPFMGPSEVRTRPLSTHTSSFSRTARLGSVSHMRGTGVPVRAAFSQAAAVTSAAFIVPVAFTAAPPGRRRSASHPGTRPRRPPPSLPRPKQAGTRPARHPRRTRPRRRPVRRRRGPVRAGDPCAASPSRAWCPFSGPFLWWIHPGSGRGKSPVGRSRHGRAAGMLGGGAVVPAAVLALGRDIDAGVALLADVGVVGLARRTGPRHAPPRVRIHVVHVRAGGIVARRRHDDGRLPRLGVVSHLLDPRRGRLTGLDPGAGRTVTVGGHQLRGVLAGQGRAARLERGPHRLGHLRLPLRIEVRRHLHVEGPSPLRDPHRGHGGLAVGAGVLDRHLERPRLVPGARLDLAGEPPHGSMRGHRPGIAVTRDGHATRPPVLAPHGRYPPGRIRQTGGTVPP